MNMNSAKNSIGFALTHWGWIVSIAAWVILDSIESIPRDVFGWYSITQHFSARKIPRVVRSESDKCETIKCFNERFWCGSNKWFRCRCSARVVKQCRQRLRLDSMFPPVIKKQYGLIWTWTVISIFAKVTQILTIFWLSIVWSGQFHSSWWIKKATFFLVVKWLVYELWLKLAKFHIRPFEYLFQLHIYKCYAIPYGILGVIRSDFFLYLQLIQDPKQFAIFFFSSEIFQCVCVSFCLFMLIFYRNANEWSYSFIHGQISFVDIEAIFQCYSPA